MPAAGGHIWGWFWELDGARGNNGYSILPLTFSEIAAWAGMTGREPSTFEVRTIREMDRARIELVASKAVSRSTELDEVSTRDMSAGLFDALFQ